MSKYVGKIVTNQAPAGYSVYFDGSGDYLSVASNAAFAFGTGDFTLEFWLYPTSTTQRNITFPTVGAPIIYMNTSRQLVFENYGAPPTITSTGTLTLNTWSHCAVSRASGTTRLFLNGVLEVSSSSFSATSFVQSSVNIGTDAGTTFCNGYMANVRVVKGTALYTAAFTPPTQLFNVTNTSLLTCNSPAIVDQSSNAFTITTNGNAAVSTFTPFTAYVPYNPALGASTPGVWTLDEAMQAAATRQWNMYDPSFQNTTLLLHGNPTNGTSFITDASTNNFTVTPLATPRAANLSPFSLTTFATSGSGYFNGANSDAVEIANNAAFDFGTSDVTVEAWVNLASTSAIQNLIDCGPSSGSGFTSWTLDITASGFIRFGSYVGGTYQAIEATSNALATNQWYHIAFTRSSGTNRLFVNGAVCTTTGTLTQAINSGGNTVLIGRGKYSGFTRPTTGYFSNVRIVKGVGVYTGAFTTPTAPLTATQAAGTNISAITGTQTSLLTLQNSQSANNNAFLDSSSNNFTITRNGNTTQGSFSPFSQTGWSGYFNSGAYISSSNWNNAGVFGTSDFTVECWVYAVDAVNSNQVIWSCNSYPNTTGLFLAYYGSTPTQLQISTGATALVTSSGGWSFNQWHHVAVTRSGTTLTLWINGVSRGSTTFANNCSDGLTFIGRPSDVDSYKMQGYISNLRITKSAALYTSSFSPPTTALTTTVASGTVSLLCLQSNRFVDNSSNAYTLTPNGSTTPSVQAFSPFYPTAAYTPQTIGGSGYFDGTGDYLTSATNTALQLGSSDFSIEWWEYRTAANNVDTAIVCGDGTFSALLGYYNSGAVRFYLSTTGSSWNVFSDTSAGTTASNSWNHFVLTRSGTAFRVFLNGVLGAYATGSGSVTQTTNQIFISGGINGSSVPIEGYMSGVRFVKGSIPTSYQTSSTTTNTPIFTPPTAPVTTTSQGATSGDVKYLVNFTNAGIVDSTAKNVLETVGNAQISTTQSKFGGSSMFFNGTTDKLITTRSPLFNFGSSDLTVEGWFYTGSSATMLPIYSMLNGAKADVFAIQISGGIVYAYATASGGATWSILSGVVMGTVTYNAWNHIALVRNGSTWNGYVNGVRGSGFPVTNSSAISAIDGFTIGEAVGAGFWYSGYIDDLRITRFARYTANFTPQTSQWQDQ